MKKNTWSGTGRRLFIAFSAFIALYAAASFFALIGIEQIHTGLTRTRARVEGMRVALDLASAVRDQYAHVAHTIIIGNDSHAKLFSDATTRVLKLTDEMHRHVERPDEQVWVNEIEQATNELDRIYRDRILPNVRSGQTSVVQELHHQVLLVVARIQDDTDRLARRFEESIAELQTFVTVVERRAFGWSLVFLLVAPLLAGWVGIVIGRSVARPIAILTAGAERIAAGDLDTRIDVDSRDEFGALARQFNTMAASVKEHQRQLLQSEKLAGIGRLAAGVAHEINNPLGVILGYVRVLGKKADPGLAEDLKVIETETLRCKEIVDGLLDLSRPVNRGAELVELREVCDDVVMRLAESEQTRGMAIAVEGQAAVQGDALKLRQVVFNLVKNAAEAAGPTGRVEVNIVQADDWVELSVSDTGPGFDASVRERLFEPFFTTKQRGIGLGLAVSQAIARAHGGEIVVGISPVGARLTLRLPRLVKGVPP